MPRRCLTCPCVLVIAAASALAAGPAAPPIATTALSLAEDGQPRATIVLAKEATDLQRNPAVELQEYVRKITGALLPIADDSQTPGGNLVLVGQSRLTQEMAIDLAPLTGDSFLIKAVPGRLVLAGRDARLRPRDPYWRAKRGTANAVAAFLEDYCGVAWFMPGRLGEVVPRRSTLRVPPIDKRETPYRLFAEGSFSASPWAWQNSFGESVFISPVGCHLWDIMIPPEKYFTSHPEWFALIDGKRTPGDRRSAYLCTSSKEMWAEALRNLKELYAPGYEMVVLCQADGYRRCQCDACEAMDDYRISGWYLPGKPADRIWLFHDFLARGIQKAFPDRKLIILAYGPTGEVPHRLKNLPSNVIVEWCHPTSAVVARWKQFHDQFSAFVYWFVSETRNYVPMPMSGVAAEYKRLSSAGVRGFYFCGGNRCWGTSAPTYYLVGQLLRDPKRSEDEVLDRFCEGLFEQSAAAMKSYFKDYYAKTGHRWELMLPETSGEPYDHVRHEKPQDLYLASFPEDVLQRCERDLKQAEDLARDDVVKRRIRLFQDGFEYSKLTARAFARLKDYRATSSEENLAALKDAVDRRNRFVVELFARQKANQGDLPEVFSGTLEQLLYGDGDQLAVPFRSVPKAGGKRKG
jgi:hypothetical protein